MNPGILLMAKQRRENKLRISSPITKINQMWYNGGHVFKIWFNINSSKIGWQCIEEDSELCLCVCNIDIFAS